MQESMFRAPNIVKNKPYASSVLIPDLCTLEGGFNVGEGPSSLCFLLTPPGGSGRAARMLERVLALSSPEVASDLLGLGEDSLEDSSIALISAF